MPKTQMHDDQNLNSGGIKRTKHRSPNYPAIGLKESIQAAHKLEAKFRRATIPINLAHECLGYKPHSGAGNQAIAALKAFGFIDVTGEGTARQIQINDVANHIIRKGPDRARMLKVAALKPSIYRELWEKYQPEIPEQSIVKHYLLWDRKEGTFNPDVVDGFIKDFRDSLVFAELIGNHIIVPADGEPPAGDLALKVGDFVKVGDYVQSTINGSDQFNAPRRIEGISDDGQFAFVEGSSTGLQMDQLTKQEPPILKVSTVAPPNPFFKGDEFTGQDVVEEKKIFDEGAASIRWPDKLSKESVEDFDYWVKGILRRLRRKAGLPHDE